MAATLADGGRNPVTGKQVMARRKRAWSARGDGDRRTVRRLRQVAVPHRAAGQERRRRRHHRGVSPASSASPSCRLRSTRRATASRPASDRGRLERARRQPASARAQKLEITPALADRLVRQGFRKRRSGSNWGWNSSEVRAWSHEPQDLTFAASVLLPDRFMCSTRG